MVRASLQPLTFEAFVERYSDDTRFELIDGEPIDLEPTGPHEEVAAFVLRKLNVPIELANLQKREQSPRLLGVGRTR